MSLVCFGLAKFFKRREIERMMPPESLKCCRLLVQRGCHVVEAAGRRIAGIKEIGAVYIGHVGWILKQEEGIKRNISITHGG